MGSQRAVAGMLLLAALLSAGPAVGQVARLELMDPPDSVRVGRPLRVLLTVRPPADGYPIIPTPSSAGRADSASAMQVGDAVVTAMDRRPPAFPRGARVDSAIYTMAVFTLDTATVGPLPVGLVVGADTAVVQAAPLRLAVAATTAPTDSLRPPGPPLDFPRAWGPWAIGAALGVAAAAVAARTLRRRERRPARPAPHAHLPPYEQAIARLDALEHAPLDTPAGVEAHHVELADALRTYLSRAYGIDSEHLTSAGVLRRMASPGISDGARLATADVLRETDLVKFAARRPDAAALAAARARAREALDAMRPAAERQQA